MIYGPFNLSQAKDGLATMKTWFDIEGNFNDYMGWGVSIDNDWFYGTKFSGYSGGWIADTIDLKNVPTLGNVTGRGQVWIAFYFRSDASDDVYEEGAAIDNIVVSVCNSATGCSGSPSMALDNQLPGTIQEEPGSLSIRIIDTERAPNTTATFFSPRLFWPKLLNPILVNPK